MRGPQIGFIAQDVQKVLPSIVITESNRERTLGLKYNEFIPLLTKAIQEQQAAMKRLQQVNDLQTAELHDLQSRVATLTQAAGLRDNKTRLAAVGESQ